jgi:hypothetical protein
MIFYDLVGRHVFQTLGRGVMTHVPINVGQVRLCLQQKNLHNLPNNHRKEFTFKDGTDFRGGENGS